MFARTPPFQPTHLSLAKTALYRFADTAQQITCGSGSLWITQDNDPRDIILAPGESFTTDGRHQVIAYALDPATLSVSAASVMPAPRRQVHRGGRASGLALE